MTNEEPGEDAIRMTPVERLVAAGFELDENGNTVEIGYVGTKYLDFEADPWEWCDNHEPACVLHCETTRKIVAKVWQVPTGMLVYRTGTRQPDLNLLEGQTLLDCPMHGAVLVPSRYIADEARSARSRQARVICTDPHPRYAQRS